MDENPTDEWPDPDRSDAEECPPSIFPGAGRRVDEGERQAALEAEPAGNAEIGDTVDTDEVDSRAHDRHDRPERPERPD